MITIDNPVLIDLWRPIVLSLDNPSDLKRMAVTCKQMNKIVDIAWKQILLIKYPNFFPIKKFIKRKSLKDIKNLYKK